MTLTSSVTSVTVTLRLNSDLWCAAVLRENRLQLFTATSQNTHLTVFENCRVPTDTSDTSYRINCLAGIVTFVVPQQALILLPGEKGLGVMQSEMQRP